MVFHFDVLQKQSLVFVTSFTSEGNGERKVNLCALNLVTCFVFLVDQCKIRAAVVFLFDVFQEQSLLFVGLNLANQG